MPAPLGYLNQGIGKAKQLDPAKAPLVRKAFELYASGRFNLKSLLEKMYSLGLRNRRGGPVTLNGMSRLLNNQFYIGVINIKKTGQKFAGAHPPLITRAVFKDVQDVLH
jgi:site-specific DNA recombinase